MKQHDIYIMNITSEVVVILILLFLFVTCILQRKQVKTVRALMLLILADISILSCQITEWSLMLLGNSQSAEAQISYFTIKKIVYTADYSLYYFVAVAFYNYIRIHIGDVKKEKEESWGKSKWLKFLLIWGIVITCLFGFLMNQSFFYFMDASGHEMYHKNIYLVLYIMGMLATLSSAITLIRNRKALGKANFVLLLAYIVTPYMFVLVDLLEGTCVTYLLFSFYTFILYIYMDMRKEREMMAKEEQLILQEKELNELNTQIMLSQMQPHFLYNTLSTISGLCYKEGAVQAKHVVDKFSQYFRENLDAMGKEKLIPFDKELTHLETYLWLEQIRFGAALNIEYDIEVSDFYVPSLSVQPLVENAVKHGIRRKKGGGTVTIQTKELSDEYQIIISDDGAGYVVGTVPDDGRSHTGIENIKNRLQLICNGSCEITSEIGKGTTVIVHIPKGGAV